MVPQYPYVCPFLITSEPINRFSLNFSSVELSLGWADPPSKERLNDCFRMISESEQVRQPDSTLVLSFYLLER
jgi:hypothetical protein